MEHSKVKKEWQVRSLPAGVTEELLQKTGAALGLPKAIVRLLALRGLSDRETIAGFLNPSLAEMPRPRTMKGMDDAVAILLRALAQKKPVTVFGDFDADGVTATALLSLFFRDLDLPGTSYIPDRLQEGYGLNHEAIKKIHADNMGRWGEAGVLVTVDCGISDAEVVTAARELGFAVIVTDHHRPPAELPPADAVLNPHQPGCPFPCKNLAGVGVAFYLLLGLRSALVEQNHWKENSIPNLKSYMDLVAIGTVADQVDLTGCNRIIVKSGLEVLNRAERLGLVKLLDTAGKRGGEVTVDDIAFRVAPRINAVGRIGSAAAAVRLMTTTDPAEAQHLAMELEHANSTRKEIEAAVFDEAAGMILRDELNTLHSLVLYRNNWHPGVLGIVANRLVEKFCRPAILLTDVPGDDRDDAVRLVKGSGRSVEGIDLHAAIASCHEMLYRYGGHAGAVGLTLGAESIGTFRKEFNAFVAHESAEESVTPILHIDQHVSLADLADPDFLAAYGSLGPFGAGNREPVFCLRGRQLANSRLVGGNHLRFSILEDGLAVNGIGFNFGSFLDQTRSIPLDLAFTLRLNSWQGQDHWELNLVDLQP
jgi:single-stranded-DNA-specific exonuclease